MGVTLTGYLAQRGRAYEAVVDVPPSKREAVGRKRLRKALGTTDVHVAKARLRRALVALHAQIDAALRQSPTADPVTLEAMEFRRSVEDVRAGRLNGWSGPPAFVEDEEFGLVQEDAKGITMGLLSDSIVTRAEAIQAAEGAVRAQTFADVAFGRATPITHHVEEWLAEPGNKGGRRAGRTVAAFRSIIATFAAWAKADGTGSLEAVTRRVAGRYVSKLHTAELSAARISTVASALATYWEWLERRGVIDGDRNPWRRQAPPKSARGPKEDERAFTDAEVVALLTKAPDPVLCDLMRLAALTGARIEELCRLTVAMCAGNVLDLPGSKTAAAARRVPIHPALATMVEARCRDKAPKDYLLHELGHANKHGERSAAIGKRFGRWRQLAGVHDKVEGQRRSKVNFHSWRRWFITKAIQAHQPTRLVSQVVGHQLKGMTEGVYFGGDTIEALRACVEAVRLPEAARTAAPIPPSTPPSVRPRKARRETKEPR